MSQIKTFLAYLESDAEADLAPVAIGALALLAKTPGLLGVAAAKLYILGNAPPALMKLEQDFVGQIVTSLSADLAALQAKATAAVPPVVPTVVK